MVKKCPTCGYVYLDESLNICPLCGSKLLRSGSSDSKPDVNS